MRVLPFASGTTRLKSVLHAPLLNSSGYVRRNAERISKTAAVIWQFTMTSPSLSHQLLADYGSPLYVYDADYLRATIERIARAVPYPHTKFYFASVVNGNVALLKIFRERGWGLHANTPGDVFLGLHAGFAPEQMVYSGSNLNADEMAQMLERGVSTLNLDSLSQLELLSEILRDNLTTGEHGENHQSGLSPVPPRVPRGLSALGKLRLGFRLNLPEITGENRIGVSVAELRESVKIAASVGLKVSGLHFYRGTGTNATEAFTESIAAVLEAGKNLPDWEYLDFGGGFGYPYRADEAGFDWEEFGGELSRQISTLDRPIELFIEPGRAAIAGCGTLLATVVSVKWQDGKQIIGVDSSVANIAVLSVHGGWREIRAVKDLNQATKHLDRIDRIDRMESERRPDFIDHPVHPVNPVHFPCPRVVGFDLEKNQDHDDALYPTDVCGNTTYSRDYLGRNCKLPLMQPGEVLAILDAGAYGYAMASHFLHRPRPAEVLIGQGAPRLIRRREAYSVLLEHQAGTDP